MLQADLEEIIERIKQEGFKSVNARPWSKLLATAKELFRDYEIRAGLGNIEELLRQSGFGLLAEKYSRGERICIGGIEFQKLIFEKANDAIKMLPLANSLAMALVGIGMNLLVYSLPFYLASIVAGPAFAFPFLAGLYCVFGGLIGKMGLRAAKAFGSKQNLYAAYQGLASLGGTAKLLNLQIPFLPFIFDIALFVGLARILGARKVISYKLPEAEEIREDVYRQAKRFAKIWAEYRGKEMPKLEKAKLIDELAYLNQVVTATKTHSLDLKKVAVDIDYTGAFILPGAWARAELFTGSIDLFPRAIHGTKAEFAKVYGHELAHLDGDINEGAANFKADKLLAELAVAQPGKGYDYILELGRLVSAGHAYSLKTNKGLADLILELHSFGIPNEAIDKIIDWVAMSKRYAILFFMQHVIGGSDPRSGYTIDHYKLVKAAQLY